MPLKLSLPTKIAGLAALGIGVVSLVILAVVVKEVKSEMRAQAQAKQELSMRVGWELLRAMGEVKLVENALVVGTKQLDGDTELVDRLQRLVGGTATIFRNDTRVSTNIKTAQGSRAVGTKLAQGPAYDAVLNRGVSYRGEADILGES
ncbi:cache domain-containing protein [Rhodoplanes sp. SY1]